MSVRSSHARFISVCVRGWHEKGRVEADHGADVEKLMKQVDPMNRLRFWIKKTKDAFNVNVHRVKLSSKRAKGCSNHDSPQEQPKGFPDSWKKFFSDSLKTRTVIAWSYDMEGHARKCVERYRDLANQSIEQSEKSPNHAWMIISS